MLKSITLFIAILLALLALPILFPAGEPTRYVVPEAGLPWQIEPLPDGTTRVFGLTLGRSTLEDARQRLGPEVQVALIVAPGEAGAVEAFYESIALGALTGKMVLTLETSPARRAQILARARKAEYMESTTRRITPDADDLAQLRAAVITAIVYIPAANLDESIVLQRFGVPAERIRDGEHREHFLYPDKGLDLQLDLKGKEVLQYVAPAEFHRLRDPLVSAAGKKD
jgi:hypothetical protein